MSNNTSPFTLHILIGEPGLAVNWLEETRAKSSEEVWGPFEYLHSTAAPLFVASTSVQTDSTRLGAEES